MTKTSKRLLDGTENFSAEELWAHHKSEKYATTNLIAQQLVDGFFRSVSSLLSRAKEDADTFLEVGCGPGDSSLKIAEMLSGKSFEVSEFDDRFIEMFDKTKFPIPYRQETVYEMNRDDNAFDCVMLLEVLEHLEDFERALAELTRVSNKYVVISVPHEPYWRMLNMARVKYLSQLGNTPGHVNNWTGKGFESLVGKYGKILQIKRPIPWQMVLLDVSEKDK